jgi:Cys-rich protein (TIGR01571 family)
MAGEENNALIPRGEARQNDGSEDGDWSTGLCSCFADPGICCLTLWCPCVSAGKVAQKLGKDTHWLPGALVWALLQSGGIAVSGTVLHLGCLYSCHNRKLLRQRFNLRATPCPDGCTHWFCWSCALCQELRELKARETEYYGFDEPNVGVNAPGQQKMGR